MHAGPEHDEAPNAQAGAKFIRYLELPASLIFDGSDLLLVEGPTPSCSTPHGEEMGRGKVD